MRTCRFVGGNTQSMFPAPLALIPANVSYDGATLPLQLASRSPQDCWDIAVQALLVTAIQMGAFGPREVMVADPPDCEQPPWEADTVFIRAAHMFLVRARAIVQPNLCLIRAEL